jgi:hypothetical protein
MSRGEIQYLQTFSIIFTRAPRLDYGPTSLDAELHSDLQALLIEIGSKQQYLWGINSCPNPEGEDFIEFDSMMNMRPSPR